MIGNVEMCSGLYIFKVIDYIERQLQPIVGEKQSLFFVFSSNKDSDVIL